MTATTTLNPGALVTYHGSIRHEHGNTFYVADVDPQGRFTLIDRDYPNVTQLRRVRPGSVRPTGQAVPLCECGHEAGWARFDWNGRCELRTCACTDHTEERPA